MTLFVWVNTVQSGSAEMYTSYGVNFLDYGEIFPDLQRYDIITSYDLPKTRQIFETKAHWLVENLCPQVSEIIPLRAQVCQYLRPLLNYYVQKIETEKDEIARILDIDIPAVLPDILGSNTFSETVTNAQDLASQTGTDQNPIWHDEEEIRQTDTYRDTLQNLYHVSDTLKREGAPEFSSQDRSVLQGFLDELHKEKEESKRRRKRSTPVWSEFDDYFPSFGRQATFRRTIRRQFPALSKRARDFVNLWKDEVDTSNITTPTIFTTQQAEGLTMRVAGELTNRTVYMFRGEYPFEYNFFENRTWADRYCRLLCSTTDKLVVFECFKKCATALVLSNQWLEPRERSTSSPPPTTTTTPSMEPTNSTRSILTPPVTTVRPPICINPDDIELLLNHSLPENSSLQTLYQAAQKHNWNNTAKLGRAMRLWNLLDLVPVVYIMTADLPSEQQMTDCRSAVLGRQLRRATPECFDLVTRQCMYGLYMIDMAEIYAHRFRSLNADNPAVIRLNSRIAALRTATNTRLMDFQCQSEWRASNAFALFVEGNVRDARTNADLPRNRRTRSRRKRDVLDTVVSLAPVNILYRILRGGTSTPNEKAINENFDQIVKAIRLVNASQIQQGEQMMALAKATAESDEELYRRTEETSDRLSCVTLAVRDFMLNTSEVEAETAGAVELTSYITGTIVPWLMEESDLVHRARVDLQDLLHGIDALASGRLTHRMVPPTDLACWLKEISRGLSENYPDLTIAMPGLNEYYANNIVTSLAKEGQILIHIPVYLRQRYASPLKLYKIQSVPLPLDRTKVSERENWSGVYTHIRFKQDYFAQGIGRAHMISENDLKQCQKFGETFFCETPTLVTYTPEHSCAQSVFRNHPRAVQEKCDIQVLVNHTPSPRIMSDTHRVLVVGMPSPWNIRCPDGRPPQSLVPAAKAVFERMDLCGCTLEFGDHEFFQPLKQCEESLRKDGVLKPTYPINTAAAYLFQEYIDELQGLNDHSVSLKRGMESIMVEGNTLMSDDVKLTIRSLPLPNLTSVEKARSEHVYELRDIYRQMQEKRRFNNINLELKKIKAQPMPWYTVLGLVMSSIALSYALFTIIKAICKVRYEKQKQRTAAMQAAQEIGMHRINMAFQGDQRNPPSAAIPRPLVSVGSFRVTPGRSMLAAHQLPLTILCCTLLTPGASAEKRTEIISVKLSANTSMECLKNLIWGTLPVTQFCEMEVEVGHFSQWLLEELAHVSTLELIVLATAVCVIPAMIVVMKVVQKLLIPIIGPLPVWRKRTHNVTEILLSLMTTDMGDPVELSLGRFLGAPNRLEKIGNLETSKVAFKPGWFSDMVQVRWLQCTFQWKGAQVRPLSKIRVINPFKRAALRHVWNLAPEERLVDITFRHNFVFDHVEMDAQSERERERSPMVPMISSNTDPFIPVPFGMLIDLPAEELKTIDTNSHAVWQGADGKTGACQMQITKCTCPSPKCPLCTGPQENLFAPKKLLDNDDDSFLLEFEHCTDKSVQPIRMNVSRTAVGADQIRRYIRDGKIKDLRKTRYPITK